jgi:acid stress chaperone HdeB
MKPKLVVSILLVVGCFAMNAQAQVTIDASKITCAQFAHSKVASSRSVAVWLSGYYAGKQGNPVIDPNALEEKSVKLERFCQQEQNFKLPVMNAVEQIFGKK